MDGWMGMPLPMTMPVGVLLPKVACVLVLPLCFVRLLAFPFPLFNKRLLAAVATTTATGAAGAAGSVAVPKPCTHLRAKKELSQSHMAWVSAPAFHPVFLSAGRRTETVCSALASILVWGGSKTLPAAKMLLAWAIR